MITVLACHLQYGDIFEYKGRRYLLLCRATIVESCREHLVCTPDFSKIIREIAILNVDQQEEFSLIDRIKLTLSVEYGP